MSQKHCSGAATGGTRAPHWFTERVNKVARTSRPRSWLKCCILLLIFLLCQLGASETKILNVGFLVLNRVYNSELMAPYDIFHHTVFHTKPGMKVFTISPTGGRITTFEGLRLETDFSMKDAPEIDVLVIPSAEHNMNTDLEDQQLMEWVAKTSESADYILTLCDGAFILANTGLLDGKEATTFPSDLEAFRKMFPQVKAHEGYSFVHDGKYITSQGGARSYDAAMYLVAHLYGDKVAAGIGRGMVLPWPDPSIKFLRIPD